jgi:hypothetical protein
MDSPTQRFTHATGATFRAAERSVSRRLLLERWIPCFQSFYPRPHLVCHHVLPNAGEHSRELWIGFRTLLDFLDVLLTVLAQQVLDRACGYVAEFLIRGVRNRARINRHWCSGLAVKFIITTD